MTASIPYTDRASWFEARRQGIGGSDAAAILGVSRWRTPVDVWEDKVLDTPDRPPSVRMDWGRRLEDVVADAVAERLGLPVRRSKRILVHRDHPFIIGSVDRLMRDAVLEVKTARSGESFATEEEAADLPPEKRVPADYYVQGQHYAAVTRKPRVVFGVLVGGSDLRILETPADPEFIGDLVAEEVRFWNEYVVPRKMPPLSGGDAARLPRLFPRGSGEKVATPEIDAIVRELLTVRDQEDAAKARRADLEVKIEEYLGEASDLVSSVARFTWRERKGSIAWSEVAGSLRSAIVEFLGAADADPGSRPLMESILRDGFGTTDLDAVEELYRGKPTRTPRLDRKGAK